MPQARAEENRTGPFASVFVGTGCLLDRILDLCHNLQLYWHRRRPATGFPAVTGRPYFRIHGEWEWP